MNRHFRRMAAKKQKTVSKRVQEVKRSCGECTVCCTVLGVPEIQKTHNAPCLHLEQGCNIYASRPKSCRDFECLWKLGLGSPEDRPDLSGIFFDVASAVQDIVVARECQENALERARPFLEDLAKTLVIFLVQKDIRRLLGPPDKVRLIQKHLQVIQ